jgi:hypothetical protein
MAQKNEWIIGREGEIKVDPDNVLGVSRQHAKLLRESDEFYIEDLDSTGGTYVNGRQVRRKKISPEDEVLLGKYRLDMKDLLRRIPMSDSRFQAAFYQLQTVYETYVGTKTDVETQSQVKVMLLRALPSLPGLLIMLAPLGGGLPVIRIAGGLLMVGATFVGFKLSAGTMAKTKQKQAALDEKFKIDYVCPQCKRHFGQTPWENLRDQGGCSACHRKFITG